ncbi:MAG: hypothetical protein IJ689_00120 [Alphaproteobacteria bacterium]|nr:hypothetical protein [Alphaproteobacteria bacterium]
MKKYILLLGVAAVSIGSYCAYAGNSSTMTVTATIAHDVSLTVTRDYNVGTITIDPSNTEGGACISESTSYKCAYGITSITGTQWGRFTANVADSCKVSDSPCFTVTPSVFKFGGITLNNAWFGHISDNTFEFVYDMLDYDTVPTSGDYSSVITINYNL